MQKVFSFLAGMLAGAAVGAVTVLLLTPASGEELQAQAQARWEQAVTEARQAMEETRREKEREFEQMKVGTPAGQ